MQNAKNLQFTHDNLFSISFALNHPNIKLKSIKTVVNCSGSFQTQQQSAISLMSQDEGQYHEVVYFPLETLSVIPVLISALATTTIVLLSLFFKFYRRPLSLMILAINIAHVLFYFSKLSVLVLKPRSDFHCKILGIIDIFGLESAAFWATLFSHLFYIILKHQSFSVVPIMLRYYLFFAVLLPFTAGVLSFFTNHVIYSADQGTCVHRVYLDRIDITGNLFVRIPIGFACIACAVWYKMALNQLKHLRSIQTGMELYAVMIYPAILVICWGPNFFLQIALQLGATPGPTVINGFLFLAHLHGLWDALVYGRSVREIRRDSIISGQVQNNSKQAPILAEKNRDDLPSGYYSYLSGEGFLENNSPVHSSKFRGDIYAI